MSLALRAPNPAPVPALIEAMREASVEGRARSIPAVPDREAVALAEAFEMASLLARMLPALMRRRPSLWAPGTPGMSFDEAWLVALATALRSGDADSARFLIGRRARPERAAVLRMLLGDLAARLG
jgi:hypothetical protein